VSHPGLCGWTPGDLSWTELPPTPTPIEDAVAVGWRDRWLVVVSGWSDGANTDATQVFDPLAGAWATWEPFPGTAVFGATGALDDDTLVLVDGVADTAGFPLVHQTWAGHFRDGGVDREELADHPGPARYRAAGGSLAGAVFVGGADRAYNYDGRAYADGSAAEPIGSVLRAGRLSVRAPAQRPSARCRAGSHCCTRSSAPRSVASPGA